MATEVPVTGVLEEKEEIDVDFLSNIFSYQSLPHLRGFFRVSFHKQEPSNLPHVSWQNREIICKIRKWIRANH